MLRFLIGIFMLLHGLVHLFYFGQSWRLFELQPDMTWPDGSWAFSRALGEKFTRKTAGICCVLAALAFVVGGIAILLRQAWWQPVVLASAAFSSIIFLLFWDGKTRKLHDKGGIAILINVAVIVLVLLFGGLI